MLIYLCFKPFALPNVVACHVVVALSLKACKLLIIWLQLRFGFLGFWVCFSGIEPQRDYLVLHG